jgi:hypothetical protein
MLCWTHSLLVSLAVFHPADGTTPAGTKACKTIMHQGMCFTTFSTASSLHNCVQTLDSKASRAICCCSQYGEPFHGLALFKDHNPLSFGLEQLRDLLSVSQAWFVRAATMEDTKSGCCSSSDSACLGHQTHQVSGNGTSTTEGSRRVESDAVMSDSQHFGIKQADQQQNDSYISDEEVGLAQCTESSALIEAPAPKKQLSGFFLWNCLARAGRCGSVHV